MPEIVRYRADIDGLRAIAVTAVVLHHSLPASFPGGYLGVDIFFVISGYLIGTLLLREARGDGVDLIGFYRRRIVRIVPAFAAVLFATYAFGLVVLTPRELTRLDGAVATSLAFSSNFYFARAVNYFDAATTQNPLLHTWSLSVEEQFYLVFPVILIALTKARVSNLNRFFTFAFLASCAAAAAAANPQRAYFWPHLRASELMIGILIAENRGWVISSGWLRNVLGALCLAVILAAVFAFSAEMALPALWPLVPCAAAGALIAIGRQGSSLTKTLLSQRPLVFTGLASFSLYLVHWPVLFYASRLGLHTDRPADLTLILSICLLLAALSWKFIEQPVRHGYAHSNVFAYRFFAASTVTLLLMLAPSWVTRGLPHRFDAEELALLSEAWRDENMMPCLSYGPKTAQSWNELVATGSPCRLGSAGALRKAVLWGDSHAASIAPGVSAALARKTMAGALYAKAGCPPLLESGWAIYPSSPSECRAFASSAFEQILASDAEWVILHCRWLPFIEGALGEQKRFHPVLGAAAKGQEIERLRAGIRSISEKLRSSGKKLMVIGPSPDFDFKVRDEIAAALHLHKPIPAGAVRAAFEDRQAATVAALKRGLQDGDVYVDLADALCERERCGIGTGTVPLYNDDNHVSETNALRVAEPLSRFF